MGDRFYMQQKNYKPGRRLKKDALLELEKVLGTHILGLDKLTIVTIDELASAIKGMKDGLIKPKTS
jgi:hypothetical protein